MLIEILILLFFLVASLYLAYQFRSCGHQMVTLQGSNATLSADLEKTREENLKLMSELQKTPPPPPPPRAPTATTRAAPHSCPAAINGGS